MFGLASTVVQPPRVFPPVAKPPTELLVFDARQTRSYVEKCLVASAQGLANSRLGARRLVYVEWNDDDVFWLDWLKKGYVRRVSTLPSLASLLKLSGRDAVVYDENPSHLPNIATSVAGCERAVMVGDPELLKKHGLKIKVDLRGVCRTNADAYQWLNARYGRRLSWQLRSITVPNQTATHNPANLRDYLVASRALTYWISGEQEKGKPGADTQAERAALEPLLKGREMTATLGYPWSGEGFGPGEWDGVSWISEHGQFLVPTDNFNNLSVWTAFPRSQKKFRPTVQATYDPKATYAALVMSDGDNACTFQQWFRDVWRDRKDFSFPVGWTMAPTLRELAPPIYDWYVERLPARDSVGTGVSGLGYIAVEKLKPSVVPSFVAATEQAMKASGQHWIWAMRYGWPGEGGINAYAAQLGHTTAIMGGYGKVARNDREALERMGRVNVFHSVVNGDTWEKTSAELEALMARPDHPRAFHIFLMNWSFRAADLEKLAARCKSLGITLVTPEDLDRFSRA